MDQQYNPGQEIVNMYIDTSDIQEEDSCSFFRFLYVRFDLCDNGL